MLSDKAIPGKIQVIEKEGKPEWVVIPYEVYIRILAELRQRQPHDLPEQNSNGYDEAQDLSIALLQGPTDLSERHEDILRDEIQPYSGWTNKEPSS